LWLWPLGLAFIRPGAAGIVLVIAVIYVGINQVVWEPAPANTLHFESDEQLAQDSRYLLVVSRGVHDSSHAPLDATTFRRDLNFGQTKNSGAKAYRKDLLDALPMAMAGGVSPDDIAAASLFTTQSINAISRKIRTQLTPAAAIPLTGRRSDATKAA